MIGPRNQTLILKKFGHLSIVLNLLETGDWINILFQIIKNNRNVYHQYNFYQIKCNIYFLEISIINLSRLLIFLLLATIDFKLQQSQANPSKFKHNVSRKSSCISFSKNQLNLKYWVATASFLEVNSILDANILFFLFLFYSYFILFYLSSSPFTHSPSSMMVSLLLCSPTPPESCINNTFNIKITDIAYIYIYIYILHIWERYNHNNNKI